MRSLSRPAGERRDRHKPVRRLCAASSGRRARRFRPGGRRGREYLAVDPPADVGLGRLEFGPAGSQRPGFRACFSRPLTRSPGAGDGRLVAGDLSPITASSVNCNGPMFPGVCAENRLVADHAFASKSAGSGGSSPQGLTDPVARRPPPVKPPPPAHASAQRRRHPAPSRHDSGGRPASVGDRQQVWPSESWAGPEPP